MIRIHIHILCLVLICIVLPATTEKITAEKSETFEGTKRFTSSDVMSTDDQLSKVELHRLLPCLECHKKKKVVHRTAKTKQLNSPTKTLNSSSELDNNESPSKKFLRDESGKIEFSRKYSPDLGSDDDGFVPIPGPYGTKTRLTRAKSPSEDPYKLESTPRNVNGPMKDLHRKSSSARGLGSTKRPQDVQRRSQFRGAKSRNELTGKESVANENLLGNGNFEIIKGGIYSDQDANEILGSRRMGRGFGSYVMPPFRQNPLNAVQNVRFSPFYQRQIQNPFPQLYYPRAPY